MFGDCYRGCRVLLTGHTGFKGSWLALWLLELGADVVGVGLKPDTEPNHWDLLALDVEQHRLDIRDNDRVARLVADKRPTIIFHLAAQSLVRRAYVDPLRTWSTNVLGTANILEASRLAGDVRAIVVVTSDKCYDNKALTRGYHEDDSLGGHDPYSASKAAAELVADSYRRAYFDTTRSPLLATARAGNVIGGGDWCEDRLIPDLVRAVAQGRPLQVRSPSATRPWQHVLESLSGYLLLGQWLLEGHAEFADRWNFGPVPEDHRTVSEVLERFRTVWPELSWQMAAAPSQHEAGLLHLDITKSRVRLGWKPVWTLDDAIVATSEWYQDYLCTGHAKSKEQLGLFAADARQLGLKWASSC